MSKNRIVKPVSFNLEKESKIIDHINKYDNFSSYVKYLIINDMNSNNNIVDLIKSVEDIKELLKNERIDINLLNNSKKNENKKIDEENTNVDEEQKSIISSILNIN